MPGIPNYKLRQPLPPPGAREDPACAYAELDVVTNFSFLRGASHADELVFRAAELGYRAIAITDINTLAGVVRAHDATRQVKEQGGTPPKLIIGSHLTFEDAPDLLVWAADRAAYGRLCRLLTIGKRRAEKGECELRLEDFLQHSEGLIAAIVPVGAGHAPPCPRTETDGDLERGENATEGRGTPRPYAALRDALGDRLSLATSCIYGSDDAGQLADLARLGRRLGIPLLATNNVHYHIPERRMLQDILTCIRHGCTIQEAGFRLFSNGERYLKSPEQMHRLFADYPAALRRGIEIAERCTFSLDELRYEYPREIVPAGQTPIQYLTDLTWRGAAERYAGRVCFSTPQSENVSAQENSSPNGVLKHTLHLPPKLIHQLTHELTLIEQLHFEPYFLTVYDLVQFARSRGILCQGRGSAANSAVCYCLGITSVDPAQIDLLFERFISAARNEPPDIDVDFEHERREEVIQYLYEKYGRERAGMTAEVITYRGRSAVRDVGKALGLSLDTVEQLAKKLDWWDRGTLPDERLRELGLDPNDKTVRLVVDLTGQILGFPRHLSQHVGGMVMTQGPLCELVPIENASMEDRTVIEWDKDDIDALGILKVDVLALGMLTCISKAFTMINRRVCFSTPQSEDCPAQEHHPINGVLKHTLQLHTIPPEDPAVYEMLSEGDSVGVFQVESRAQMSMLPRLKPKCFYDLVIEVAIVRPGPIQGNMVHPYLRRRNGEEPVEYPSEALRDVLRKTLGVPLFQEQAMRVAMVGASFSAEEADRLRRAMAAWRKSGALDTFRQKIINGMLKNGYTREFAERCFLQIRGFGEYGFPESHAASFARLVYVSAWLKRYHPAAFCAALLNSQPMGFYAPAQIVRDAQGHGVIVRPVDVNFSDWGCTLEDSDSPRRHGDTDGSCQLPVISCPSGATGNWQLTTGNSLGPAVRLGFRQLKGLRQSTAIHISAARGRIGRFISIAHFRRHTGLSRATLKHLAEADAFASLHLPRREALWQVMALDDVQLPLFDHLDTPDSALSTQHSALPSMPLGQEVMTDYCTAGLSLKRHPVSLVREQLDAMKIVTAEQVRHLPHGRWVGVAGLVLIRQRPGTASGIVFETLEDETGVVNLIIRPNIYDKFRQPARHAGLLHAQGYVEKQGKVIHIMVWRMYDLSHLLEGCQFISRDFR